MVTHNHIRIVEHPEACSLRPPDEVGVLAAELLLAAGRAEIRTESADDPGNLSTEREVKAQWRIVAHDFDKLLVGTVVSQEALPQKQPARIRRHIRPEHGDSRSAKQAHLGRGEAGHDSLEPIESRAAIVVGAGDYGRARCGKGSVER